MLPMRQALFLWVFRGLFPFEFLCSSIRIRMDSPYSTLDSISAGRSGTEEGGLVLSLEKERVKVLS